MVYYSWQINLLENLNVQQDPHKLFKELQLLFSVYEFFPSELYRLELRTHLYDDRIVSFLGDALISVIRCQIIDYKV